MGGTFVMGKNYNNNRNQNRNNGKRYITALEKEKLENEKQLRQKYANVSQSLGDARVRVLQLEQEALNTVNLVNQVSAMNSKMLNEKYPNCDIGQNGEIIPRKESGV